MFPSLTTILGGIFLIYVSNSIWSLTQLFSTLVCTGTPCFTSYLANNPKLQLALFTSVTSNPIASEVTKMDEISNFDYHKVIQRNLEVDIPLKTRRNGTLFMHIVLALHGDPIEWRTLQRSGPTVIQRLSLTQYAVPQAATFNLLGEKGDQPRPPIVKAEKPKSHFYTKAHVNILTDNFAVSQANLPPEFGPLIRINRKNEILPIVQVDFFKTRLRDLVEITRNTTELTLTFDYSPVGVGKLRLMLQIEHATKSMKSLGFSDKDIDEVKGIFSDTNVYLLCGTVFVGSIHVLFDFLSFKNDVMFWRRKRNYAGLSTRTTIWRAFSQIIIFLYLLDENTSLLVLIPAGIAAIIEMWKCKKILKIEFTIYGLKKKHTNELDNIAKAELKTQEFDKEAMRYLSYLLYPLCIGGAIYSLIYQPHRSWYSWTLNSMVNGVYAFGFLFMLPQLFVNYKLKSVAALPWRSFMYKAFNTFIDDIFAFIITMPIAHRVACFRDDVVFVIYLYQRWLYPVDKSRLDTGLAFEDEIPTQSDQQQTSTNTSTELTNDKKTK